MADAVWIGLCGRSGAGKGYVSEHFAALGIPSIDTDAVYHGMIGPSPRLSPCMRELAVAFGTEVILPDGALDRRAVAARVFAPDGEAARAALNRITHRHILEETRRLAAALADRGADCVLIDAPLLFESGFDAFCRYTVCVVASEEASVARIVRRDGISEEEARRRLASQLSAEELTRRCDFTIRNDLHQSDVAEQVRRVAAGIREKRGERT